MGLGWSETCCICGKAVTSYHNPDPVRDGMQDCCSACNQLVIRARRKSWELPEGEQDAYILRLRGMTHHALMEELGAPRGGDDKR